MDACSNLPKDISLLVGRYLYIRCLCCFECNYPDFYMARGKVTKYCWRCRHRDFDLAQRWVNFISHRYSSFREVLPGDRAPFWVYDVPELLRVRTELSEVLELFRKWDGVPDQAWRMFF